jgi:RNA recognition motif-containing protein
MKVMYRRKRMRIYVGNLPYNTTEDELKKEFEAFGEVTSVSIPIDRDSRRSKGFGFVDMPTKTEAEAAIAGLNGKALGDRPLTVNEARPRTEDASGKGYGDFKRGGGGGGDRDKRERRY